MHTPAQSTLCSLALVFRTFVKAARRAFDLGLMGKKELARVVVQAVHELEELRAPSISTKWRDLIFDIRSAFLWIGAWGGVLVDAIFRVYPQCLSAQDAEQVLPLKSATSAPLVRTREILGKKVADIKAAIAELKRHIGVAVDVSAPRGDSEDDEGTFPWPVQQQLTAAAGRRQTGADAQGEENLLHWGDTSPSEGGSHQAAFTAEDNAASPASASEDADATAAGTAAHDAGKRPYSPWELLAATSHQSADATDKRSSSDCCADTQGGGVSCSVGPQLQKNAIQGVARNVSVNPPDLLTGDD
ncbi:hypothetical protein cyc_08842 [Cyclospora cayetanensis]|uniref:Uncharacterized protein n=1 Tax=Cyclospora cayetanensis TaxID=88456 RepID=A0A1D3D245_9EIME|nr:hypothetical protein cyc_08842 [Cyclospora cayetanensis]